MTDIQHEIQLEQLYELRKKSISHIGHAFMTLITVGFWLPIWALAAIAAGSQNKQLRRKLGI